MPAQVRGYEFNYVTPTQVPDGSGGTTSVDIPTAFTLSGITDDVAKGIRQGLRNVPSIKNVTAERVLEDRATLP